MTNIFGMVRLLTILAVLASLLGTLQPQSMSVQADALTQYTPEFEFAGCLIDLPSWVSEGQDVRCGNLLVPENRADPNSRQIKVAVSIVSSLSDDPLPDPIVMLQGGPGGSSVETFTAAMASGFADELRENRDLIFIDQRGSSQSSPSLVCDDIGDYTLEIYTQALPLEEENRLLSQAVIDCQANLAEQGINWEFFNSLEMAGDIEDLRIALGYEQFNLYGVSYGSLLALHVLRYFPNSLRTVMIDAVVPPQISYIAQLPTVAEDVFDRYFDACATDPVCSVNYPNLEAEFAALVDQLNADPVAISITHPVTLQVYDEIFITGDRLVNLIFQSMYSTTSLGIIPRIIFDLKSGNYVLLKKIFRDTTFDSTFSDGVHYAVNCQEDGRFDPSTMQLEGVRDYLQRQFLWSALGYLDTCNALALPNLSQPLNEVVSSDVPVLVYVGEFDPIISADWGLLAAESLPDSDVYIFPGVGHGAALDDTCPYNIMVEFVNDPNTTPDPSCILNMDIEYSLPTAGTYTQPDGEFTVLVPNGWEIYEEDGHGHFVETETNIDMYALAIPERDLSIGIAKAINEVFPNYNGEFIGVEAFPIGNDEWATSYFSDGENLILGTGLYEDGTVYVHLTLIGPNDDLFVFDDIANMLFGFDFR